MNLVVRFSSMLVVLFMFSGCATNKGQPGYGVKFSSFGSEGATLQSKTAAMVEVFVTNKPNRPYRELGFLVFQATNESDEQVIQRMREKAAMLGADAVIIMPSQNRSEVWRGRSYESTDHKAVAITYAQ